MSSDNTSVGAETHIMSKTKNKISIGQEIWRWCKLKSDCNLKSHCEVAKLLLDIYEVHTKCRLFPDLSDDDSDNSSAEEVQPPTSTITKPVSQEASSPAHPGQIVKVKIETVDVNQEEHVNAETTSASVTASAPFPIFVKSEPTAPVCLQTFPEHNNIKIPGLHMACGRTDNESPCEESSSTSQNHTQNIPAVDTEILDTIFHIERAEDEQSESEDDNTADDGEQMETDAATGSQSVSSSTGGTPRMDISAENGPFLNINQTVGTEADREWNLHIAHLVSTQGKHKGSRPKADQFICQTCFKVFARSENLKRHISRVHDKKFICSYCDRDFKDQETLEVHRKSAHQKTHLCTVCGSVFVKRAHLNEHEKTHSSEKPYPCPFEDCQAAFLRKVHLQDHLNVHLDVKPYECLKCQKRFRSSNRLSSHMCNTRKKEQQCPKCDAAFFHKVALRQHIRSQHHNKKYACNCGASYSWMSALSRHRKSCAQ